MSFIRKKEIPKGSGNWYAYKVETYRVDGKPRQRNLGYIGKINSPANSQKVTPSETKTPQLVTRNKQIYIVRAHPLREGIDYAAVHAFIVEKRKEQLVSSIKYQKMVMDKFNVHVSCTGIIKWIRQIGLPILGRNGARGVRSKKKNTLFIPEPVSREIFAAAMQSNTGLTLIDQLTEHIFDRDFRNDVRQQSALYYIEEFERDHELTEVEARVLINRAVKCIRKVTYSSPYQTVDLYKPLRDGEDDRVLLDVLADKSSFGKNPLDLLCEKEAV